MCIAIMVEYEQWTGSLEWCNREMVDCKIFAFIFLIYHIVCTLQSTNSYMYFYLANLNYSFYVTGFPDIEGLDITIHKYKGTVIKVMKVMDE